MKNKKRKLVFRKLFSSSLKRGDYVKFFKGRALWKVTFAGEIYFRLRVVQAFHSCFLRREERDRVYKLSLEEAIRETCLRAPWDLSPEFSTNALREFFRKNLKEG